jgi:plastocyanin
MAFGLATLVCSLNLACSAGDAQGNAGDRAKEPVKTSVKKDADWGTVKGKVVWADKELPKAEEIVVGGSDPKECLRNGPLFRQTYVVDKDTKGVHWAVVWLIPADTKDKTAKLPIAPALKAFKEKVEVDQPCCMFEPHVTCIRQGQKIVYKNSGGVSHNVNIVGGSRNPNLNQTIPPGKSMEVDDWKASPYAVEFSCGTHKWMKGWVRVFDHPYFAVTNAKGEFEIKDAPAGDYRIVGWHETNGYILPEKSPDKFGIPITIKKGDTTEVKINLMPEKK